MNIHPLTHHYGALRQLPGVVDVTPTQNLKGEGINIQANNAAEADFLDEILADSIKGHNVSITHNGPEIGIPQKDFYPAEEILEDYETLIKALPGVDHLATVSVRCGGMLPAYETAIEVVTESAAQVRLVQELLEPEVAGTQIFVRGAKQKPGKYSH